MDNGTNPNLSVSTWFHWVKLYSVIAAAIGFTAMHFSSLSENNWIKFFLAFILEINIFEAVARYFELGVITVGPLPSIMTPLSVFRWKIPTLKKKTLAMLL